MMEGRSLLRCVVYSGVKTRIVLDREKSRWFGIETLLGKVALCLQFCLIFI